MKQLFLILLALFPSLAAFSQNDTLILINKDQIIGEIKEMERGVLVIETDYSDDDFSIKWKNVLTINSEKLFVVMLRDGSRLKTTLHSEIDEPKKVTLKQENHLLTVSLSEIVYIKKFDAHFFSRLNGSFSVGYNYTKSNSLSQFSFLSDVDFIADRWNLSSDINMIISNQKDADKTRRTSANIGSRYFFKKDWFSSLKVDFLSNDEQKLKLRTNVQLGAGNFIMRTNKYYFAGGVGIAYNVESYTQNTEDNKESYEAFLTVESNVFDLGDLDVFFNVIAYPSLTEKGRFRSDVNVTAKYSLPFDLYIKFGYTNNFDNKPVAGASKSDYVIQTSFGWDPS